MVQKRLLFKASVLTFANFEFNCVRRSTFIKRTSLVLVVTLLKQILSFAMKLLNKKH